MTLTAPNLTEMYLDVMNLDPMNLDAMNLDVIDATLAISALAVWIYLAIGRGGFWRCRENDRAMVLDLRNAASDRHWPSVAAIIPARNEADLIGTTTASLLSQAYPGELSVTVVDDNSDDDTASAAAAAVGQAGVSRVVGVVAAPPPPAGWTGKLWALAQGVDRAAALARPADYLLFSDADIRYPPEAVAALVLRADKEKLALSSLMVALRCESLAERALIPAYVFFFQMIYPFSWVNDPGRRVAAAAGGCTLVRRTALLSAGGLASIKGEIIDDCALGTRLKRIGPIHVALSETVQSLRRCPSFSDIRRMIVRTAFAQLHFSVFGLLLVVAAMLVVFVAPVLLGFSGNGSSRPIALATWTLMVILYAPIARRYRISLLWGIALPLIAVIYLLLTIESAVQYGRGRGGVWKGRAQAPRAAMRAKGLP
jgi:hopene-associated glycosyltransferase HpnB